MASKYHKHRQRFQQKATEIRTKLADFEKAVANNYNLPRADRERVLIENRAKFAGAMGKLRAEYSATLQAEMRKIRQEMWSLPHSDAGSGWHIFSYRDATYKARAVKDGDEALYLLDVALASGDRHMLRALGLVAESHRGPLGGWGNEVHRRLAENDPDLNELMAQYNELEVATGTAERVKDEAMFAMSPSGSLQQTPEPPDLDADRWGDEPAVVLDDSVVVGGA